MCPTRRLRASGLAFCGISSFRLTFATGPVNCCSQGGLSPKDGSYSYRCFRTLSEFPCPPLG